MKIALVGDFPPPFGGVSVHVATLARALRARRMDVRILDIGRGGREGPGVVRARGVVSYAAQLARVAAERRLVHVHTSGANGKSWLVALGASRARLPGSPLPLLTLHSGLLPGYLGSRPGWARAASGICSRFGHVLAVSPGVAAALETAGVPRALVSVEPAFLAAQLATGERPPAVEAFRALHAPIFCAAVAPGPVYGEHLLVEAFRDVRRRLPGAGLVVFGQGSDRGPAATLAREPPARCDAEGANGPSGSVLALGEIEHAAALAVLATCDVFVRATRADGDALSVREALALGRTVVASAVGHRPPGCLLFRANDAAHLADRMVEAARPPGDGGARRLPVRDSLDRILDIYRSLARGRPIPADSPRREQAAAWTGTR